VIGAKEYQELRGIPCGGQFGRDQLIGKWTPLIRETASDFLGALRECAGSAVDGSSECHAVYKMTDPREFTDPMWWPGEIALLFTLYAGRMLPPLAFWPLVRQLRGAAAAGRRLRHV